MPNEVINRVHKLSRRKINGIEFTDRNGDSYEDEITNDDSTSSSNSSYTPSDNSDGDSSDNSMSSDDSSFIPDLHDSDSDESTDDSSDDSEDNDSNSDATQSDGSIAGVEPANDGNGNDATPDATVKNDDWMDKNDATMPILQTEPHVENNDLQVPFTDVPTETPEAIAAKMDDKYGKQTNLHNLRRRKRRDYSHLHTSTHTKVKRSHKLEIMDTFMQYSMYKNVKCIIMTLC